MFKLETFGPWPTEPSLCLSTARRHPQNVPKYLWLITILIHWILGGRFKKPMSHATDSSYSRKPTLCKWAKNSMSCGMKALIFAQPLPLELLNFLYALPQTASSLESKPFSNKCSLLLLFVSLCPILCPRRQEPELLQRCLPNPLIPIRKIKKGRGGLRGALTDKLNVVNNRVGKLCQNDLEHLASLLSGRIRPSKQKEDN